MLVIFAAWRFINDNKAIGEGYLSSRWQAYLVRIKVKLGSMNHLSSTPAVSGVLLPVYNGERHLRQAIASICDQRIGLTLN
ncbi:MAG: hypothetical protein U0175_20100 [Caldilineaceae bacterium]